MHKERKAALTFIDRARLLFKGKKTPFPNQIKSNHEKEKKKKKKKKMILLLFCLSLSLPLARAVPCRGGKSTPPATTTSSSSSSSSMMDVSTPLATATATATPFITVSLSPAPTATDLRNSNSDGGSSQQKQMRKVFAPYVDMPAPSLSQIQSLTNITHFTLTCLYMPDDGSRTFNWGGAGDINSPYNLNQIQEVKRNGGDVILSFGCSDFPEFPSSLTVPQLSQAYMDVLDRYNATMLDFDIEGSEQDNMDMNVKRSEALAALKSWRGGKETSITFTLGSGPEGLVEAGLAIMKSASDAGLQVDILNLMTMDYGMKDTTMGVSSITAAQGALGQLQTLGQTSCKVGLTPMVGRNDEADEVFTMADAQEVRDWAAGEEGVILLSFWSLNRDMTGPGDVNGNLENTTGLPVAKYAYSDIFKTFGN